MRIFAHRGVSALAPENTLSAARLCKRLGVSAIEFDVDVLACGTPVVIHDSTLDRTTNLSGPYSHLRATDLSRADAGAWKAARYAGEPLPLLDVWWELLGRDRLYANLELKNPASGVRAHRALVEAVAASWMRAGQPGTLISSFSPALLRLAAHLMPQAPRALLVDRVRWLTAATVTSWLRQARQLGATALHPANGNVTRELIQRAHDAGLAVNVWTVNSVRRAEPLAAWRADGVFSDYPHRLVHLEAQ